MQSVSIIYSIEKCKAIIARILRAMEDYDIQEFIEKLEAEDEEDF